MRRLRPDAGPSASALSRAYRSAHIFRPWEPRADAVTRAVEARLAEDCLHDCLMIAFPIACSLTRAVEARIGELAGR